MALSLAGCGQPAGPLDPPELIAAGWDNYRLGEFDRAIRDFERAAAQTSGTSRERLESLYGQATTWNLRRPGEDPDQAQRLYRQIIAQAPPSDLAAWSLLALARMKHLVPVGQEPDYAEVQQAYQEVIDRFPHHLAGEEAFVYQQSTRLVSFDEEEARQTLVALERFLETHRQSRFVSVVYSLLAQCCATLRQPEKRLGAEVRALETAEVDPANPFQEQAGTYWKIATMAEFEAGDFATARRYYRKLIEEYPADIRHYGAKQALKRMEELETTLGRKLPDPP